MKIGIFSKFDISGGSEMRCIELANSIRQYTKHRSTIFCMGKMADRLKALVNKDVSVHQHAFNKLERLYDLDCLIVVNTDSRLFTTLDFWTGKSEKHQTFVDLTKIKQMIFLFNFLVSPSKHLSELEQYCPNLKIITTNTKFFQEIGRKYGNIIHIPRIILESPINPERVNSSKIPSDKIRIGCLSKPVHDKWNNDWYKLIEHVNSAISNIQWRFLGCPQSLQDSLTFENIEFNKEFAIPVKDFLENLDIFVYFPSFKREEPWSRSVAEGLLSGCPVITTNRGGNIDQIVHGNNGFICTNLEEFQKFVVFLCQNQHVLKTMKKICLNRSQYFTSPQIIKRLMDFIQW